MTLLRSDDRGTADLGWLQARYSFSFANYYDPSRIRFRTLRVLNEDRIQAGAGFGTHGHEDMEILTYVLEGALEHKDNLGESGVLRPGDLQLMSAGRGIEHSEFNASKTDGLHLMQIWILPDRRDYEPRYQQLHFDTESRRNQLRRVASATPADGLLHIRQDAEIFASILESGQSLEHCVEAGRGVFIQNARGRLSVDDRELSAGDSLRLEEPGMMTLQATDDAEFLLFDLG
ncbi:MAG: pirin family protein [Planctomycetota bacterium]